MGNISTLHARNIFTAAVLAIYEDQMEVTSFFRSYFPAERIDAKFIKILVQRGFAKIATDVKRGTKGNRNEFGLSSEKHFLPSYYYEWFDATQLDLYDKIWNTEGTINTRAFAAFVKDVAKKVAVLIRKINRAYELQCSEALHTGIITLENGDNIDFKRKAPSLQVFGAGIDFASGAVDPNEVIGDMVELIRTEGRSQSILFNAIMGKLAFAAYKKNANIKDVADIRRYQLVDVTMPQRQQTGGVLHGIASVGSHQSLIWTYPEFFDTEAAKHLNYMEDKDIIVLPENPSFNFGFTQVPQLLGKTADVGVGISGKRGDFFIDESIDEDNEVHKIKVKSAGAPVLTAVDQVATATVLA